MFNELRNQSNILSFPFIIGRRKQRECEGGGMGAVQNSSLSGMFIFDEGLLNNSLKIQNI